MKYGTDKMRHDTTFPQSLTSVHYGLHTEGLVDWMSSVSSTLRTASDIFRDLVTTSHG